MLAVVNSVAFCWNGEADALPGYNNLLERCLQERSRGVTANTMCGIMAITPEQHQGKGIARHMFAAIFGGSSWFGGPRAKRWAPPRRRRWRAYRPVQSLRCRLPGSRMARWLRWTGTP